MTAQARFPFSAVVGQGEARLALLLAAVDPGIGGVLLRGDKGAAKSTLARGLAGMLPGGAPFVELPLGATEDTVVGTIDTSAVRGPGSDAGPGPEDGAAAFRPGLLAAANGGVLYVDEVNLLPDPVVDVLLDVAASGVNWVGRDGVSHSHPARFVLVGSMNPEEGELRPQLLDRFGLSVEVKAPSDPQQRAEIVRRRLTHDAGGRVGGGEGDIVLRARLAASMPADLPDTVVDFACRLAVGVGAEGLRADLVLCRAAAAFAGWEGREVATSADVERVAAFALGHRRRRRPFDPPVLGENELERALGSARQSFTDAYRQLAPPADSPGAEDATGDGNGNGSGNGNGNGVVAAEPVPEPSALPVTDDATAPPAPGDDEPSAAPTAGEDTSVGRDGGAGSGVSPWADLALGAPGRPGSPDAPDAPGGPGAGPWATTAPSPDLDSGGSPAEGVPVSPWAKATPAPTHGPDDGPVSPWAGAAFPHTGATDAGSSDEGIGTPSAASSGASATGSGTPHRGGPDTEDDTIGSSAGSAGSAGNADTDDDEIIGAGADSGSGSPGDAPRPDTTTGTTSSPGDAGSPDATTGTTGDPGDAPLADTTRTTDSPGDAPLADTTSTTGSPGDAPLANTADSPGPGDGDGDGSPDSGGDGDGGSDAPTATWQSLTSGSFGAGAAPGGPAGDVVGSERSPGTLGSSGRLGRTGTSPDDRAAVLRQLAMRPRTPGGIALADAVATTLPPRGAELDRQGDDLVAGTHAAAPPGSPEPERAGRTTGRTVGRTVIVAVDASGTVGTHRRVEAATGAVLGLLSDAYLRRDRISLVTFRGDSAEVVLPPTASIELARTRLAELPTGGVTPLAEGISTGLSLARRAETDGWPPLLVLITDGRATGHTSARERADAAAAEVAADGVEAVIIDAGDSQSGAGAAEELATATAGRCIRPTELTAAAVEAVVRDSLR